MKEETEEEGEEEEEEDDHSDASPAQPHHSTAGCWRHRSAGRSTPGSVPAWPAAGPRSTAGSVRRTRHRHSTRPRAGCLWHSPFHCSRSRSACRSLCCRDTLHVNIKIIVVSDCSHSDECPYGTGPQTPNHILQSCPTFDALRRQTWPRQVDAHRKLRGPVETLRQTADFALFTGLKI